jgi:hypothetical protein
LQQLGTETTLTHRVIEGMPRGRHDPDIGLGSVVAVALAAQSRQQVGLAVLRQGDDFFEQQGTSVGRAPERLGIGGGEEVGCGIAVHRHERPVTAAACAVV